MNEQEPEAGVASSKCLFTGFNQRVFFFTENHLHVLQDGDDPFYKQRLSDELKTAIEA